MLRRRQQYPCRLPYCNTIPILQQHQLIELNEPFATIVWGLQLQPNQQITTRYTLIALAGASQASVQPQQKGARRLMQYTGAVVAGSRPSSYNAGGYQGSAYNNPAVGLVNNAMATGQAPSDIGSARARGWVRGKFMGQAVNADGVATASMGHNNYGGVTAVGNAYGQYQTSGPYGYSAGQGGARAAAATTLESANGYNVVNGAAAGQAWGQMYGSLPSGQGYYARGSASAQAEGTIVYTT